MKLFPWRKTATDSEQSSNANTPAVNNAVDEQISITDVERMSDLFGIMPSFAGPVVSPKTSMKVSIVFACVRLISGALQQMPVNIYKWLDDGERQRDPRQPLNAILNLQPTAAWSAAVFWEYMAASMLLHGDGLAVIMRNRNGDPEELLPISPVATTVENRGGRLVYFTMVNGESRGFYQDDILHFPGFGFNGLRSMSVIKWGAYNSIGLELAMEEHSGEFFNSGSQQNIAVLKSGKWGEDQKQAFREAWVKTYGGTGNRKYPFVMDQATDIKTLSISAKDSQLLESREFQITDIARAFGIPSFLVNQEQKTSSWGTGMAEIGLAFLRFTMGPHLNRFEQELNRKLFMGGDYFAEFNTSNLMRMTLKERNEAYRQAVGGSQGPGWITQNEVRRWENLPKHANPSADELYDPKRADQTQEPQSE